MSLYQVRTVCTQYAEEVEKIINNGIKEGMELFSLSPVDSSGGIIRYVIVFRIADES